MSMNTVRRMASSILGMGQSKIRFSPAAAQKASEALTRDDVRGLIDEGSIGFMMPNGTSRARARIKKDQQRAGRRSGRGSKKGTKYSKVSQKDQWIAQVRAQRGLLKRLTTEGKLEPKYYRKVYLMIKGNAFKSKANIQTYLKDNGMMKK